MTILKIQLKTPTIIRLQDLTQSEVDQLNVALTYENKPVYFELQRLKNNPRMKYVLGKNYIPRIAELEAKALVNLLKSDQEGYFTYAGLLTRIRQMYPKAVFEDLVVYPEQELIPWAKPPSETLRYYQKESVEVLLNNNRGAIELATGLGKSLIIRQLTKEHGLPTIIMAPTQSIFTQLYETLKTAFGAKYVGRFGDGKKEPKLFTVCIADSLATLTVETEGGTPDFIKECKVFICDESHLCPAETLAKVCLELLGHVPHRYFVSGTQVRNDGADLMLEAIIGDVLYTKSVKEGVEEHFLAKPNFRMIKVGSDSTYYGKDVLKMGREVFLKNESIAEIVAKVVERSVAQNQPVLVFVDELEQVTLLEKYLKTPFGFAFSSNPKKIKFGKNVIIDEPTELVKSFNNLELPVLIGTSCINTGTDFKPVSVLVNWQSGTSVIKFPQTVGRGTRLVDGKTEFWYFDFLVSRTDDYDPINRHCKERSKMYQEIYPSVKVIDPQTLFKG